VSKTGEGRRGGHDAPVGKALSRYPRMQKGGWTRSRITQIRAFSNSMAGATLMPSGVW
jgi:hypothetical protein